MVTYFLSFTGRSAVPLIVLASSHAGCDSKVCSICCFPSWRDFLTTSADSVCNSTVKHRVFTACDTQGNVVCASVSSGRLPDAKRGEGGWHVTYAWRIFGKVDALYIQGSREGVLRHHFGHRGSERGGAFAVAGAMFCDRLYIGSVFFLSRLWCLLFYTSLFIKFVFVGGSWGVSGVLRSMS